MGLEDEKIANVACDGGSMKREGFLKHFTPDNRKKTYKKAQFTGYILGFISITCALSFNFENRKSDKFFILYVLKPLIAFGILYVVVVIYRTILDRYKLRNIESGNAVFEGIVETVINFMGAFMFTYYFVSVALIIFNVIK